MIGEHLNIEELHLYVDGQTPSSEQPGVKKHLLECERCRRTVEDLQEFEKNVRSVPLEHVSPAFTRTVMIRLSRSTRVSLAYRLISTLAPLLGTVFVLGVLAGVIILAGGAESTEELASGSSIWNTVSEGTAAASTLLRDGTNVLQKLFPFLSDSRSGTLSILVVTGCIALAVVDRLVFRRIVQRL